MKRLLSRVVEVRPGEATSLFAASGGFFCLLCGYYLLRPLRDALGIAGGFGKLQWLFTATFIAMLLLVPLYGLLVRRLPPRRFVPLVFRFFNLDILLFAALFALGIAPVTVGHVFFIWLSVYNLFVVSMFWSALADRFNSEQGRRLFAFIAAGGTAGALVGPGLAATLSVAAGPVAIALLAAGLLEVTVQCFRVLSRNTPAAREDRARAGLGGGVLAGLGLLLRDRYLAGIALYFLLHTLASTLLYLEQSRLVSEAAVDTATRTRLFALIDLAVSCTTILLQLFVTSRFIRHFGLAAALATLPLVGVAVFAAAGVFTTLWMLAAAQALRRASDYAISRPAREVLFTVISREAKYKVKSAIETVVYRGGDAASGWVFALAGSLGVGFAGLAWLMLPVGAGWAGLAVWLARRQARSATLPASAAHSPNG